MDNELLREEGGFERTPEEAVLLMRLRVFVTMRWLAVLGIIIATFLASQVFNIGFPTLPVYIVCVMMASYNLVLFYQVRGLASVAPGLAIEKARTQSNVHIFLDLIALTVLLHFTGGVENPFIFFFVFHIILASGALSYRKVYLLATSAIAMVILLVGLEYAGLIPHVNLEGFATPILYKEGSYITAVLVSLATILYATTYMATAVSGELRKRQREVVRFREHLLQDKMTELEESSKQIARLEEEKQQFLQFVSMAAHDLKAPLTAIQGFLWVMLGGYSGEITDKQRHMLERSTHRIKELLELISDLLDIPRIKTGQLVQEMKPISLRQVVRDCLDGQRGLAKEKGIKLKLEMPDTLPKISGSSSRLQQVMTNLVSNAINYTNEGTITIRLSERGNYLQVEAMDTGIGIKAEDLPRLFEDFFRASNTEVKGTGLGLSIVKRIVEAHGGRIWVESPCPESNTGSKFTFTLPKIK
ncbi:sensor histidine kinase [Chloroflexota bacterium]